MIKYVYNFNADTGLVERALLETYPDLDILDRGLKVGRKANVVLKGVRKAYEGLAEQPIVEIEEQWWGVQSSIQELESKLKEVYKLQEPESEFNLELTEEQLSLNKEKLDTLLKDNDSETIEELTSKLTEEISVLVDSRSLLEEGVGGVENKPHEWLMAYRNAEVSATAEQSVRPVVEVVVPKEISKKLVAHERNLNVRNLEDTVADLAKMNSLLFSMVSRIYEVLDATTKDNIPAADKAVMEYAIDKFKTSTTRADKQLTTEGLNLVDKLFEREVAISNIVDEYLGDN